MLPVATKPGLPLAMSSRRPPATRPATTWVAIYAGASLHSNRLATARPMVTAGLKWAPETWPTAYAIVITVSPKASATPRKPMPTEIWSGLLMNLAAITALPQPPNTSQKVPRNSAPNRADILGELIVAPDLVGSTGDHVRFPTYGGCSTHKM